MGETEDLKKEERVKKEYFIKTYQENMNLSCVRYIEFEMFAEDE